ncbi:MAG: hypothetical protein IRY86_10135 [Thermorudis peleae]|nr:hypothetical protein [Thermorudis peleae]
MTAVPEVTAIQAEAASLAEKLARELDRLDCPDERGRVLTDEARAAAREQLLAKYAAEAEQLRQDLAARITRARGQAQERLQQLRPKPEAAGYYLGLLGLLREQADGDVRRAARQLLAVEPEAAPWLASIGGSLGLADVAREALQQLTAREPVLAALLDDRDPDLVAGLAVGSLRGAIARARGRAAVTVKDLW